VQIELKGSRLLQGGKKNCAWSAMSCFISCAGKF